jgi:aspartate-semialdehyde dehydrogenase
LDRLLSIYSIRKVIISSYQSVSGAGRDALDDLKECTNKYFSPKIQDNIIPCIGGFDAIGGCSEENKIVNETKKILGVDCDIFATTVRIPTSFCHGESVFVEFEDDVCLNKIKEVLETSYIKQGDLFYLSDCINSNLTYVCRLRQCGNKTIQMFIIADNLRRGAAYNAVEILKRIKDRKK